MRLATVYAAFFPAFNFAHLARCAAAIFLRADPDIVCFTEAAPAVFATPTTAGCFRTFAQRALCAAAIFFRAATLIVLRLRPEADFDFPAYTLTKAESAAFDIKAFHGNIVSEKAATVQGYPAKDTVLFAPNGLVVINRVVRVGPRLYTLWVLDSTAHPDIANAHKFFGSFSVHRT